MKREFGVVFPENESVGNEPGDQAAHAVAQGLAERCDAPTLLALNDAMTLLERVGGQFHLVALRKPIEGSDEYETFGIAFRYETRDVRLKEAKAPTEVLGLPVSDCQVPESELPETPLEPEETAELETAGA